MLGALFGLSLYLLLVSAGQPAGRPALLDPRRTRWTTGPTTRRRFAYERPVGLLASNLGIATLIPISLALVLVIHHARTRWLFSVRPGHPLAVPAGLPRARRRSCSSAIQAVLEQLAPSGGVAPQPGFWGFLVVIVLTSPIQAAAEEIFFRGYLMQALGSVVARPWFGVVTSALVFALLHGTQNLALFVNRLAFGLLAAAARVAGSAASRRASPRTSSTTSSRSSGPG